MIRSVREGPLRRSALSRSRACSRSRDLWASIPSPSASADPRCRTPWRRSMGPQITDARLARLPRLPGASERPLSRPLRRLAATDRFGLRSLSLTLRAAVGAAVVLAHTGRAPPRPLLRGPRRRRVAGVQRRPRPAGGAVENPDSMCLSLLVVGFLATHAALAAADSPSVADPAPGLPIANPAPEPPAAPPAPAEPPAPSPGGASQTSNYFNPSISVIGNFLAVAGKNSVENLPSANLRESELGLQAIVDPYARADFFISFGEQRASTWRKGFVTFTSLPGRPAREGRADAGRVRQDQHAPSARAALARRAAAGRQPARRRGGLDRHRRLGRAADPACRRISSRS